MKRLQTESLISAMNSICYVATGEPSGISEIWNGDLDELAEHLEKIEIYAEDEGMTETAKELFAAAHHIIEAYRKEDLTLNPKHGPPPGGSCPTEDPK